MADFLLTSDPKSVTPAQYRKMLREFIEERLFNELEALVLKYSGPSEHLMFEISCTDLIDFDPSLGFNIIHFPKLLLPIFDEAIFEAQTNLCAHPALEAKNGRKGSVKTHCHIRIISLPPAEYLNKPNISDIRADDVDSLIQISGKVVRTGAVRMLEVSKKYECQNPRCQYRFNVLADPEQDNMLPQPRCCPSLGNETAGGSGKKCTSTNVRELEGHRVCVDYQELKIQDSFERVSLGSIPRSIIVILEADLVDKFNAGDDVVIVGVLVRQWKPVYKKSRCSVEIALKANSIQALNAQDKLRVVTTDTVNQFEAFWQPFHSTNTALKGRDIIIRSICPQLYGLFFVKLALLLTLVGGSATHSDRGVKRRSQSHLLVVGDPGCGKSQILRFAASVISRSVLTTGIGTSGAGLTCTAVRDGSDWSLEAGALVLANDGVCCIDEFASIKEQDRVTIHEAMEQQSISVAKAGLVVKLHTRATVLACCNPKGTYDVTADISTNTAIASPLLSRFDLVLVLLDSPQKEWDKRVSTFLLQQAVNAGSGGDSRNKSNSSRKNMSGSVGKREKVVEDQWDIGRLRDYIAYVKHAFQPTMSKEAQLLLMRYYQIQRQSEERSQGRTTVRLLESLLRLSEAHARVMSRHVVELQDAVVAVACVHLSQEQTSLLDTNSTLHSDFPSDPNAFYGEQEAKVFSLLHCTKASLLKDSTLSKDMDIEGIKGGEGGERRNKLSQGFSQDVRNGRLDDMNEEQQSSMSGSHSFRDRGNSRGDGGDLDDMLSAGEVFEVNMASALSDPSAEPDTKNLGSFNQGPNPIPSEQPTVNAVSRMNSSSSSSASQGNISTSMAFSHTANSYSDVGRNANEWNRHSDQPRTVPSNNGWDGLEVEHVSSQRDTGSEQINDPWGADCLEDDHNQTVSIASLNPHPRPSITAPQPSLRSEYGSQQEAGAPIHHGPRGIESNHQGSGRGDGGRSVAQQRVGSHTQQRTLRQPALQSAPSSQHKGPSRQPVAQAVSVNRGAMATSSSPVSKTWDLPQLPPGMHRSPSGNPSSSSSSSSSPSITGKSNGIMPPPHSGSRKKLRTADSSPHSFDVTGRLVNGDSIEIRNGYRVGVGVQERVGGGGGGRGGEQSIVFGENRGNSDMNNRNGHHQHHQRHNLEGRIGQNHSSAATTQSSTQRNETLWGDFSMESKVPSPSPKGIFPVSNVNPVIFDYKKELDEEEW